MIIIVVVMIIVIVMIVSIIATHTKITKTDPLSYKFLALHC